MCSIWRSRGKIAAVESIEQDYEGNVHVCVVLDDDPGRDIGLMRQPGHRFFFAPGELEPVAKEEQPQMIQARKILIACIGNIFLGTTVSVWKSPRVSDRNLFPRAFASLILAFEDLTWRTR